MDTLSTGPSPTVVAADYRPRELPERRLRQREVDEQPMSFWDVLDAVNPLQHIPIVNTVYREMTGDTIKTPLKLIGATVLGGPIGFVSVMADGVLAEATGSDMGEHVMAALRPAQEIPATTQIADAREFIPEPVTPYSVKIAAADREFIPPPIAMPKPARVDAYALREAAPALRETAPETPETAKGEGAPSDAEVMIAAAQIAAKAHVRVPVKSNQPTGAETVDGSRKVTLSPGRFSSPAAIDADARALKMPARRTDFGVTETAAAVRARTRTPIGLRGDRADVAPAAVATAAKKTYERPGEPLKPGAAEQYEYARRAAESGAEGAVPAWFNDAMSTSLAKYQAMKRRDDQVPATKPAAESL